MSKFKPSNPTTEGPEYFNVGEEQDKDLKIALMDKIDSLKEVMSKSINEICETTTSNRNKRIKHLICEINNRINKKPKYRETQKGKF